MPRFVRSTAVNALHFVNVALPGLMVACTFPTPCFSCAHVGSVSEPLTVKALLYLALGIVSHNVMETASAPEPVMDKAVSFLWACHEDDDRLTGCIRIFGFPH